MTSHTLILDGFSLDPAQLWSLSQKALLPESRFSISFSEDARARIQKAAAYVARVTQKKTPVYGINTGFGKFAEVAIPSDQLETLQKNLILSHACGVGEPLSRDLVFMMWVMRLNTFCRGNSGIRLETMDLMRQCLEENVLPMIPSRGSVGASGDLAPSAHATLLLLGLGEASLPTTKGFTKVSGQEALKKLGRDAWKLAPKEGISLINGTQLTTALALKTWGLGCRLIHHANLSAALMIESLRASHDIAHEDILRSRNQPGALACGQTMRSWWGEETEISRSHENCGRVQDPYSLRCAPQVHGCILSELEHAQAVIQRELNSSTDNPLLFPESETSHSGGNFHALYTARVSDTLAASLTILSSISERRLALAMSPSSSLLPAFLIRDGGLNSGFMMAQVTAAALVSESKSLSHPASVDSIPTSDDREDHVSMGPGAGYKALQVAENTQRVLAIELLAGFQGLDLLAPLKSSARLMALHQRVRQHIPFLENDRILSEDMEQMSRLISSEELLA